MRAVSVLGEQHHAGCRNVWRCATGHVATGGDHARQRLAAVHRWRSSTRRSACSSACASSPPTAPQPPPRTRSRRPPAARTASASSRRTGRFSLKFRGLVQTDGRFFPSDSAVPGDQQLLRPARAPDPRGGGRQVSSSSGSSPTSARARPALFDAYSDVKFVAGVRGAGRQVQAAGRSGAAAERHRHRLRRAGAGDEPRPQPRHRPPARGRHLRRRLRLAGGRVQRRAGSRQRRRRRERCEGFRRARLHSAVQDRLADGAGRGRCRHDRASSGARPAAPALAERTGRRDSRPGSATRAAPRRRQATSSPTGAARGSRHRPTSTPDPLGLHGEYIQSYQTVSRATLRHGQAEAHRVAGHRLRASSPGRRTRSGAPRPRSRSIRRGARSARVRAGRALRPARDRRRHLPELRLRGRARRPRPRRGPSGSTGTWRGPSSSWPTTSTPPSPAVPPRAIAKPKTSS